MDSNKELERFITNLMEEDRMRQPGPDFTQRVVEIAMKKTVMRNTYRPLLPNWVWYALVLLLFFLIIFGLNSYSPTVTYLDTRKWLEPLQNWSFSFLSEIHFSKTAFYVSVVGGFLACLQMVFLKNYLNSRWT